MSEQGNDYITQAALAKHFGLAKSYITKLAKKGVLDGCRKDGKLVRACAIEAVERYRAGNRRTVAESVPPRVKESPVFTPENIDSLESLMTAVDDPNRRVQLMRDFWSAKINELKAKEQERRLIPIETVVEANQKIIKAYRDKTLSLPSKLAPVLAVMGSEAEIRDALDDAVRELLTEVSSLDRLFD